MIKLIVRPVMMDIIKMQLVNVKHVMQLVINVVVLVPLRLFVLHQILNIVNWMIVAQKHIIYVIFKNLINRVHLQWEIVLAVLVIILRHQQQRVVY